jgi:hypothetical protein
MGRPEKLKTMLDSFNATSSSEIAFALEATDEKLMENIDVISGHKYEIFHDHGCIKNINNLYHKMSGYKYYMMGADDLFYPQKDWDKVLITALEDLCAEKGHRFCVVYGDDGIMREKLPTHPMMTREFCEILGDYFPSNYMVHLYADNAIQYLAQGIGALKYVPEVKIDHRHFQNPDPLKRAEIDESYKKSNSQRRYLIDGELYKLWINEVGVELLKRYREAIV